MGYGNGATGLEEGRRMNEDGEGEIESGKGIKGEK